MEGMVVKKDTTSAYQISVLMLTYNREEFLKRAIVSITEQTFSEFEFIIVNNGSTDQSGAIAEELAKTDSRIRVFHLDKQSIAAGRNFGLDVATGKYIAFVDDDDYAEKDMLEFLHRLVSAHGADIAICGSNKEVNGKIFPNYVFDDLLVMNSEEAVIEMLKREKFNVAMPTKLIKKQLLDQNRFVEESRYDDIWTGYKLFANAHSTVALGEPKYCFRRHESNNSAFTTHDSLLTEEQLKEYLAAFRERTEYLSKKLPTIADYALYSEYSYMISMCNKITSNKLTHCYQVLATIKKVLSDNYDWFYQSPYIKEFERDYMRKYVLLER